MVVSSALLASCSSVEDKRLDICLQAADGNARELEKVLEHYAEEPEKLKAARFLISNMLYNYAYTGGTTDSLKRVLMAAIPEEGVVPKEVKDKWKGVRQDNARKEPDYRKITADLLIENIDLAFEVWERRPWSKHYSFEEFCDYILPYRLDNEPLERWRKLYHDRYAAVLDSLYQGTDVVEAAEALHGYIRKEGFVHNRDLRFLISVLFSYGKTVSDIAGTRRTYCAMRCVRQAYRWHRTLISYPIRMWAIIIGRR